MLWGLFGRIIVVSALGLSALPALCAAPSPGAGQFQANGKPVEEFHCAQTTPGKHPAVILLHGAGPKGLADGSFRRMCSDLAEHGYYVMFIEYYTQTEAIDRPGEFAKMIRHFPVWLSEIDAGIEELRRDPAIDSAKIALIGYSLGGSLALSEGVAHSAQLAAIVDYYGGVTPQFKALVSAVQFPPTLILHGGADSLVPVSQSKELDAVLAQNKRPHQIHVYPGVDHAFNFPEFVMWYEPEQAQDAWKRTLGFLDQNLKH